MMLRFRFAQGQRRRDKSTSSPSATASSSCRPIHRSHVESLGNDATGDADHDGGSPPPLYHESSTSEEVQYAKRIRIALLCAALVCLVGLASFVVVAVVAVNLHQRKDYVMPLAMVIGALTFLILLAALFQHYRVRHLTPRVSRGRLQRTC
ncbi:hypothetical protein HPB50_004859 [Hyalomma asiaticum]|uniref:Uncharacterized protein n=1 Tax=Hyalomma asiaticum TaxID=266040 RepID=A0ACB7SE55_HYAAI|nr:hypothetical protein HPB50_004859 [Hyalomma asiaticum]